MHDNFRQPFGFYLRPGPNGGPGRGNFQGPPFGNRPWGAPPCVFSAPRGPPPAGFGQPLPLPWGNCPPNFDHSRFPRPSFNPPRGGHDFRGRGGFDAGGRGGCGFRGRGGGCNAGGRGGFDGRGRGTGAGSDYFRGGGDFRGRGGFGGKGCFPPQERGGQVSMPHEGFYAEKNKAKKVKTDKRDLPKNNVFRCDSCDRGFKTKDVFDKHVSEHQLCSYEGCEYIAAPKLIKIHIQCQHIETNVATQVWKSMSPQEIEQWKAERRKNFPTKDNIARKENERQQRAARGELIDTRQFGKMRGHRGYRSRGGRWGGRGRGGHFMESRKRPAEEDQGGDESSAKRAAPDVSQESNSRKNPDARRSEALASLAAQYDASNSGDEDDAPEELDIAREAPSASNGVTEQDQQKQKSYGCTPGGGGRAGAHKQGNVSLLEKLLAKDIRHERNVILQCVYFIVENNFFQPHQHSSALEEEEHAEQGRADGASPPPVSQAPTDSGYSSNPEPANNSAPLNGISNGDSHCSVEKEVPLDSAKETPVACEVGVCCQ